MTNPAEQPASMSLRERIHQVMRDAGATNSAAQKGADYILDAIASEPAAMSATEACATIPAIAEYVAQLEAERDALRKDAEEWKANCRVLDLSMESDMLYIHLKTNLNGLNCEREGVTSWADIKQSALGTGFVAFTAERFANEMANAIAAQTGDAELSKKGPQA